MNNSSSLFQTIKTEFIKRHKSLQYFVLIIMSVFLFVGGPHTYSSRSFVNFWNLGHILLFALFFTIILKDLKWIKEKNFFIQFIVILSSTIFIGFLIEFIQSDFNRTADIGDIWRNIVGAMVAIFFSEKTTKLKKGLKYLFGCLVIILVIIELEPLFTSLIDEHLARKNFPVLADFETPFELNRWETDCQFEINSEIVRHGESSLEIDLNTSKYSGVSLIYFPSDWSEYKYIKFSVYNPISDTLMIVCRVHDYNHNYNFSDRFNRKLTTLQGWNDFAIDLVDIINAPQSRKMDITRIRNYAIFVIELPQPRTIYLDYLRLE